MRHLALHYPLPPLWIPTFVGMTVYTRERGSYAQHSYVGMAGVTRPTRFLRENDVVMQSSFLKPHAN